MIFTETPLKGVYLIDLEPIEDERGFFARTWCKNEFQKYNLESGIVQCSVSYNKKKGTLRGMHYQVSPYEEVKFVSCAQGAIYDMIVDLRSESSTFKKWYAVELSEKNNKAVYIPKGFAHGFQTLEDNTKVSYQMSEFYYPEYAKGIRWNDASFNFKWPIKSVIVSNRDMSFGNFLE